MLERDDCVVVLVDVQGRLAHLVDAHEQLFARLSLFIKGAQLMELPIVWVEQLPDKLGATIEPLAQLLEGQKPIAKASFGCCGEPDFVQALEATGRRHVLLCGIEAHVCVYQTAMQLLESDYGVTVLSDGVSSREPDNRELGLWRMERAGAQISGVEMALFELQRVAEGERFKQMIELLK